MQSSAKKIMVMRFSALGDVAMTLPVVYSLAHQYPETEIVFVTRPFFAKLFINAPSNLTILPVDLKNYSGLGGIVRLLKLLVGLQPDLVADLHNMSRTWIIDRFFKMKGVKVAMVDKMRSSRRRLFRTGEAQPSFIDRYCNVFQRLGYPVKLTFKSLFAENPRPAPIVLLRPAIGIAPKARYLTKTYPASKMRELIGLLCEKGYNVYLFGGRGDEAKELESWASQHQGCESLAGRFEIADELAIMSRLDLMISMDSANQHLASIVGCKVVSVWGSTTPACGFMPYNQPAESAVCLNIGCQPCSVGGRPSCPKINFDCMMKLNPELIAEKVFALVSPNQV